jgi:dUTPase
MPLVSEFSRIEMPVLRSEAVVKAMIAQLEETLVIDLREENSVATTVHRDEISVMIDLHAATLAEIEIIVVAAGLTETEMTGLVTTVHVTTVHVTTEVGTTVHHVVTLAAAVAVVDSEEVAEVVAFVAAPAAAEGFAVDQAAAVSVAVQAAVVEDQVAASVAPKNDSN